MPHSDHGRVAGANFQTLELGGKSYTLRPYVVGLYAEMSAFVRNLKGNPINAVCKAWDSIPASQREFWMAAAVKEAAAQSVTPEDLAAFEQSLLGTAFKLWSTLKADHIDEFPTPYAVMDRMIALKEEEGEAKLAEIMAKLHVASGEADLKNSAGQPAT